MAQILRPICTINFCLEWSDPSPAPHPCAQLAPFTSDECQRQLGGRFAPNSSRPFASSRQFGIRRGDDESRQGGRSVSDHIESQNGTALSPTSDPWPFRLPG